MQGRLDNLKLLQFAILNRKVDGIAEDVKSRKRHKKVCYGLCFIAKITHLYDCMGIIKAEVMY